MQRRANIAVGLLHRPKLLVLDEPTAGVDPQSRNQILESIEQLRAAGMAVLYTTHYMEEAERLCDRVGIIDRGRIIAEGSRRELVAQIGEHDRCRSARRCRRRSGAAARMQRRTMPGVADVHVTPGRIDSPPTTRPGSWSPWWVPHRRRAPTWWASRCEPDLESVFLRSPARRCGDRGE
ncbi:MAG: ABC transporter ATP-binding protein [Ilumatobacteraceae bacterium]